MKARWRMTDRMALLMAVGLVWIAAIRPAAAADPPATLAQWSARARDASDRLGEQWTVYVEDLRTGKPIYAFHPSDRLVPASNRKLVTTALALDYLGPDYVFRTQFGLESQQDSDQPTYHGNLVLRSDGDPTFGGSYLKSPSNPVDVFDEWAEKLHALGISTVDGDLVLDASAFGHDQNDYPDVWEPHHRTYSYAAVPSALTIGMNVLQIGVLPGSRVGRPGRVSVYPAETGIAIDNETQTSSRRGSGISAAFVDGTNTIRLTGRMNDEARKEVAVLPLAHPLDYIGANMKAALGRQGVKLTGRVRIQLDPPADAPTTFSALVGLHEAPPLSNLLVQMIRESDNFFAEQIWLATAAHVAGTADRLTARRIEQRWLNAHGLGWIEPGWDGSGLSREDQFSAQELALITRALYRSVYRDVLLDALPVAGEQGTLRNRQFTRRGGRVQAKTGTLAGVSSLTGFVFDDDGNPALLFSIIGNAPGNTNGRLAMRINELVKILVRDLDGERLPDPIELSAPLAPTPALPIQLGG